MLGDDELSEQDYRQNLLELKTWMNQKPNSSTARIAMAECLLDYAWFARGHGYSNSVTENGWKLFASRLEQSKFTLDQDSKIKAKSPRAYLEYARIALGRQLEKPLYLDLIDSCHNAWPKYHNIDISATNFLLPRWYGESGEVESFITKRADSIPGAKGDELYAQLIWSGADSLDNLFTPKSPLKWSRVQAGFKQIFKDFPDNMEARVVYLKMCRTANDSKAVEAVFDGMH